MLAKSSPSKRPRKPCKRDRSLRAPRIVSAPCAQRSEPSEAGPLSRSDNTLLSLHLDREIQRDAQRATESVELSNLDSSLTHEPTSNSPSRTRHKHSTTTRRALQTYHHFPAALPCIQPNPSQHRVIAPTHWVGYQSNLLFSSSTNRGQSEPESYYT